MSDLSRIVLVTAGGSGIGLAIAKHFAAKGCRVHICDIAQQAIDDLKFEFPDITATCADVSQVTQVDKVFDDLQRLYGGLDILVNNTKLLDQPQRLKQRKDDQKINPQVVFFM